MHPKSRESRENMFWLNAGFHCNGLVKDGFHCNGLAEIIICVIKKFTGDLEFAGELYGVGNACSCEWLTGECRCIFWIERWQVNLSHLLGGGSSVHYRHEVEMVDGAFSGEGTLYGLPEYLFRQKKDGKECTSGVPYQFLLQGLIGTKGMYFPSVINLIISFPMAV